MDDQHSCLEGVKSGREWGMVARKVKNPNHVNRMTAHTREGGRGVDSEGVSEIYRASNTWTLYPSMHVSLVSMCLQCVFAPSWWWPLYV
jgi:hypothetical protein